MGVGIGGSNGFVLLGSTSVPVIDAGDYADVYIEWTPDVVLSPDQIEEGLFQFHSCVRVILDPVVGETVFGNQDGVEEQENIDLFQAPEAPSPGEAFDEVLTLRNDETNRPKDFHLTYAGDVPAGWSVDINGGNLLVQLGPGEVRDIPIRIEPVSGSPLGSSFKVEVTASSFRALVSDLNISDVHFEFTPLGGVTVEARVVRKPMIVATAVLTPNGILVRGRLDVADFSTFYDPNNPFRVMIVGSDANKTFLPPTGVVLTVKPDGSFEGLLPLPIPELTELVCLFSGTMLLSSASCGFIPLFPEEVNATLKLTPRTLNLKSNGRWVTARLTLSTDVAWMVDPSSLELEGIAAHRVKVLDDRTLQVKFSREALMALLSPGDVTVCVSGSLTDGQTFSACDTIRVIQSGR